MAWKFGRTQTKNPTPASFVFWVRIYTAIMVAFMAWMPTATFIPHNFQDITTSIVGLTVTVANVLLPYFSVDTREESVPIGDVASMEDKK